jgi:hypothetical protein
MNPVLCLMVYCRARTFSGDTWLRAIGEIGSRFLRKTWDEFGFLPGSLVEREFGTSYPQEVFAGALTLPGPHLSVDRTACPGRLDCVGETGPSLRSG